MKRALLMLLALLSCLPAQDEAQAPDPWGDVTGSDGEIPARRVVADPDGHAYFPEGQESYYTPLYRAAGFSSLQSAKIKKGEIRFRAAYIPSFAKPLFLSYERDETGGVISIVRLSGVRVAGANAGEVELQGAVRISPEAAEALEAVAAWPEVRSPLRKLNDRQRGFYEGLDGQRWILEVATADGYTMEDVWSPTSFGDNENEIREHFKSENLPKLDVSVFVDFCKDLLMLADVQISQDDGQLMPSRQPKR